VAVQALILSTNRLALFGRKRSRTSNLEVDYSAKKYSAAILRHGLPDLSSR
jgi:hypothetical protein